MLGRVKSAKSGLIKSHCGEKPLPPLRGEGALVFKHPLIFP